MVVASLATSDGCYPDVRFSQDGLTRPKHDTRNADFVYIFFNHTNYNSMYECLEAQVEHSGAAHSADVVRKVPSLADGN